MVGGIPRCLPPSSSLPRHARIPHSSRGQLSPCRIHARFGLWIMYPVQLAAPSAPAVRAGLRAIRDRQLPTSVDAPFPRFQLSRQARHTTKSRALAHTAIPTESRATACSVSIRLGSLSQNPAYLPRAWEPAHTPATATKTTQLCAVCQPLPVCSSCLTSMLFGQARFRLARQNI